MCSQVNCTQCKTVVCEGDLKTSKQVGCVKCAKDYCSYCIQLKNILKCHSCESYFGICNECEINHSDTLGFDTIKNRFY